MKAGAIRAWNPPQQAGLNQAPQAIGEDIRCDRQLPAQRVKTLDAQEGAAQHQVGPAVAQNLGGLLGEELLAVAAGARADGTPLRARRRGLLPPCAGAIFVTGIPGLHFGAAMTADTSRVGLPAADRMNQPYPSLAPSSEPAILPAPDHQGDRIQVVAHRRKPVFMAQRPFAIRRLAHDAAGGELFQPVGQPLAGNFQAPLPVFEAPHAEERFAQDKQRPAVTDKVERAMDRVGAY